MRSVFEAAAAKPERQIFAHFFRKNGFGGKTQLPIDRRRQK